MSNRVNHVRHAAQSHDRHKLLGAALKSLLFTSLTGSPLLLALSIVTTSILVVKHFELALQPSASSMVVQPPGALVVMDVHARDVVSQLAARQVSSEAEFDWTAQLRTYWEADDVGGKGDTAQLRMMAA